MNDTNEEFGVEIEDGFHSWLLMGSVLKKAQALRESQCQNRHGPRRFAFRAPRVRAT
jgi:hypothetical protein